MIAAVPVHGRRVRALPALVVAAVLVGPLVAVSPAGAEVAGRQVAGAEVAALEVAGAPSERVLVRWEAGAAPDQRQAALARHLDVVAETARTDRVSVVSVPAGRDAGGLAAALRTERVVEAAEPDRELALGEVDRPGAAPLRDPPPVDDPLLPSQWGMRNTGQDVGLDGRFRGAVGLDARVLPAWEVTRGDPSVRVAVIDTAIDATHPDLQGAVVEELRIGAGTAGSRDHGTGVASILAARADDRFGMAGVAPGVSLISVVAFGAVEEGQPVIGTLADVVVALELAVAAGVDVINASWVTGTGGEVLEAVIADAGVPVVTAAGNDALVLSDEVVTYPASLDLPNLVTVTAVDPVGRVPGFANIGASVVDVAAPGDAVLAAVPGTIHAWQRGTSAAAPFVSGALALAVSVAPYATTGELVDAVSWTSRPLPSLTATTVSGGMLDAGALVRGVQRPVCRPDRLAPAGFTDVVDASRHRTGIDCVVAAGVARGRAPDRFVPDAEVTRGQLASMLVDLVARQADLPLGDPDVFDDVPATHTHAPGIATLHALGVVAGRDDGRFLPDAPVTRGQATALAVRTYELVTDDVAPASRRWFVDTDGTTFVTRIDRARDLGLVRGTDTLTFGADQRLRRDQAATLLSRLLDAVGRHGEAAGDDDG